MTDTAKPIPPKVGKWYRLRNGDIVGPMIRTSDDTWCFTAGGRHWRSVGTWGPENNIAPSLDIIARVRNPNKLARDPDRPRAAHKLNLQPGDMVELVAWQNGSTGFVGEAFRVSDDGERLVYKGVLFWMLAKSAEPKGIRPLFRVISRAVDQVAAAKDESPRTGPSGVEHFEPHPGDVFSPTCTFSKYWTVGKEYVRGGVQDKLTADDGVKGMIGDYATWRLVRRAPCQTCGRERE
jgi:hypothetical protein